MGNVLNSLNVGKLLPLSEVSKQRMTIFRTEFFHRFDMNKVLTRSSFIYPCVTLRADCLNCGEELVLEAYRTECYYYISDRFDRFLQIKPCHIMMSMR